MGAIARLYVPPAVRAWRPRASADEAPAAGGGVRALGRRAPGHGAGAAAPAGAAAAASISPRPAVLIIPGWLQDASHYSPLAAELRRRGYHAQVAPIRTYHWIPTLGGRSVRPLLDKLERALDLLLATEEDEVEGAPLVQQDEVYSLLDFLMEFR